MEMNTSNIWTHESCKVPAQTPSAFETPRARAPTADATHHPGTSARRSRCGRPVSRKPFSIDDLESVPGHTDITSRGRPSRDFTYRIRGGARRMCSSRPRTGGRARGVRVDQNVLPCACESRVRRLLSSKFSRLKLHAPWAVSMACAPCSPPADC